MHNSAKLSARKQSPEYPIFRGPKTASPITYRHRWHLALLIKLSLDLDVISIAADTELPIDQSAELLPLIITRRSQNEPLRMTGIHDDHASSARNDENTHLYLRSKILDDPQRNNALSVWANRNHLVDLPLRMRILTALHTSVSSITFQQLRTELDVDTTRLTTAISLMRIEGLIDFDLARPIEPSMTLHLVTESSCRIPNLVSSEPLS